FFSSTPRPPCSTLFPYTTLFRSLLAGRVRFQEGHQRRAAQPADHHLPAADRRAPALAHRCGDRITFVGSGAFPGRQGEPAAPLRSEEHTSELQSRFDLVCRLLLE